jgi:U4/U6.U5 tri-snRNP component SNU23
MVESSYDPLIQIGQKPKFRDNDDRPEPTQSLQAREALDLNKNVGKTQIVQTTTSGKGPKGPGFYVSPSSFCTSIGYR